MNIIEKPISELKPYKNNPKIHTESQIQQIMKSIELTKGLRQPIVIDKDNVIVCGHGRYEACKRLGFESIPCELVDDLTEDEVKAYRLIDNRISEGEYDLAMEYEELQEIESVDMDDYGFETFDIEEIEEVDGYDKHNDERDSFEKTFTFPIEKKQQITNYLKKHYDEIISYIIEQAENNY